MEKRTVERRTLASLVLFLVLSWCSSSLSQTSALNVKNGSNQSLFFITETGRARIGIGTDTSASLTLFGNDGFVAKGLHGIGTSYSLGAGTRLLWYPKKSAFRAGAADGTEWDDGNIGDYSTALGSGTTASGSYSTALGAYTTASGYSGTALGFRTIAGGMVSTAIGYYTTAGGDYSLVIGQGVDGSNRFVNNTVSSLMIGFNSTVPTLFVGPSSGVGTFGKVGIRTSSPTTGLQVADTIYSSVGGFKFPDGTVQATAATGGSGGNTLDQAYDQGGSGAGRIITADAGAFEVGGFDGTVFTGTYGSGTIPATGAGARMMWYPKKGAFRAGYVTGEWDDANIGEFSTAMGIGTTASGTYSTALGGATTASGEYSTAMGYRTTAIGGQSSTAMGWETTASSGGASVAMGWQTTASGITSTAMGYQTTASGQNCTAMGSGTTASGISSTAMGSGATASGWGSTAMGYGTIAKAYASVVIGRYNDSTGTATSWLATDPVFVIGNGTGPTNRSNALTVLKNGSVAINTVTPTQTLDVNGNARFRSIGSGTYVGAVNRTSDGTLTTATSDIRLKENITPLESSLNKILRLQGINFSWKSDPSRTRKIGFIAQDVEKILPELVFTNDVDGYKGINYAEITAVLTEAMKEQQKQIQTLNAELSETKAQLVKVQDVVLKLVNQINKENSSSLPLVSDKK